MRRKETNFWLTKLIGAGVLAVMTACIFLLSGCGDTKELMQKKQQEENKVILRNFRTVEYHGHSFIVYREYNGPNHTFSGLTHDPDCWCLLNLNN